MNLWKLLAMVYIYFFSFKCFTVVSLVSVYIFSALDCQLEELQRSTIFLKQAQTLRVSWNQLKTWNKTLLSDAEVTSYVTSSVKLAHPVTQAFLE